jgi:hypothetical protein
LTDKTIVITSLVDSMSLIETILYALAGLGEAKNIIELGSFYSNLPAKVASLLKIDKCTDLKKLIKESLISTGKLIIKREWDDYRYSNLHNPLFDAIDSIHSTVDPGFINLLLTGDKNQVNRSLKKLCEPHFTDYPPEVESNLNKEELICVWQNLPDKLATHFYDEFIEQYTNEENCKGRIDFERIIAQTTLSELQNNTKLVQNISGKLDIVHQEVLEKIRKIASGEVDPPKWFEQFSKQIKSDNEKIERAISKNTPKLILTNTSTADTHFHYKSNALSFVGRAEELKRLREFLKDDSNKRVKAWILLGEGGKGKSRLARELCDQVSKEGWYAGFIERSQNGTRIIPDSWRPEKPTLIIIDYLFCFGNYDVFADLKAWYSVAKDDCQHPVRVLILERDDQFITPRADSKQSWNEMQHSKEPLQLGQFTDDELVDIMCEVFKFHKKDKYIDRDRFKRLITQDKRLYKRTLFVIYHADLLANNDQQEIQNREELLNNILEREYERWSKIESDNHDIKPELLKKYKRLVFLATLMDGAPEDILDDKDLKSNSLLPSEEYNKKIYESIIDRQQGYQSIDPLEPNIFGEWFILQYFKSKDLNRDDHKAVKKLIIKAFQHKNSQIDTVLYRSIQDFPNRVGDIDNIIKTIEESELKPPPSVGIRLAWILFAYTVGSDHTAIVDKYKVISRLEKLYLTNPDVLEPYAKALCNLTAGTSSEETKREAITKFEKLDLTNPDVLVRYAKALYNLTVGTSEETKREAITKIEILDLTNPDILESYATALYNLTVGTSEETKREAITKIEKLDLTNPDVLKPYAIALGNLTVGTSEESKREAITKFEKLDLTNPDVLESYAKALYNLTVETSEETIRTAITKLEKLDRNNTYVSKAYERALFNLNNSKPPTLKTGNE